MNAAQIKNQILCIGLLTLLGLIVFMGEPARSFIYDDLHAIVDNPYIQSLEEFQKRVGIENIFNRSVLLLSFAFNYALGQNDVLGYHLVNVWLHLACVLLLYCVAREALTLAPPEERARLRSLPFLAAALQAVNPVTVESVVYLSSRSSLQATFFYLASFLCFMRYCREKEYQDRAIRSGALLALLRPVFFLGVGSKEIALTLPVMALVYLWLKTDAAHRRQILLPAGIAGVCVAAYLLLRYVKLGALFSATADPSAGMMDRGVYFMTQIKVWVSYYLNKLMFPINLNLEPDVIPVAGWSDPGFLCSLGFLIALAVLVYRQPSRLLCFAFLWAAVTLLPTSSIAPLKQFAVERRAYLPGTGFSIAFAYLFLNLVKTGPRLAYFSMTVLALFSLLTAHRAHDFRSSLAIWQDAAHKSPKVALTHNNLALALIEREQSDEAQKELETVLKLEPQHSEALINLGHIHSRRQQWAKALTYFERALALGSERAEVFYNIGSAKIQLGQPREALSFLKQAVSKKPGVLEYRLLLANTYRQFSDYDNALLQYRLVLRDHPQNMDAHNNMGVIFWNLQAFKLAESEFLKALEIQEDQAEIHGNLASLYLITDRPQDALKHLDRWLELEPDNARAKELQGVASKLASQLSK